MKKLMTFLVAVGLIFAFSAQVSAQDKTIEDRVTALEKLFGGVTVYGSARMATFYHDTDDVVDDETTVWDLQANSRMGAKIVKDKITGQYEAGLDDDMSVYTRLIYGAYNFDSGTLLIGQDYTPLGSIFYSNQVGFVDNDLLGWGAIYGHRYPQIKLKVGGLQFALVDHNKTSKLNAASGDVDLLIPKIEALYSYKADTFFVDVFGGYSTFKIEDVVIGTTNYGDETVKSWAAGVGGGLNLTPAYIKAQVYMAQNAVNHGLYQADGIGAQFDAEGSLVDEDNFGAHLVVGTKVDKYTVEAGYGYTYSEPDVSDSEKNTAMSYYLNCTVPIYGSFFVVPEIGVLDYGDGFDGEDEDKKVTYFGAKWQVNF